MLEFVCDVFRTSINPPGDASSWPPEALLVALGADDRMTTIEMLLKSLRVADFDVAMHTLPSLLPLVDWITPFGVFMLKNVLHVARNHPPSALVASQEDRLATLTEAPLASFLFQQDAVLLVREALAYSILFKQRAAQATQLAGQQHETLQRHLQQQPQLQQAAQQSTQHKQLLDTAANMGALNLGVVRETQVTVMRLFNVLTEITYKMAHERTFSSLFVNV